MEDNVYATKDIFNQSESYSDDIISEKVELKLSKYESFEKLIGKTSAFYLHFFNDKTPLLDVKKQLADIVTDLKLELKKDDMGILEILSFIEIGNRFISHSLKTAIFAGFIGYTLNIPEQKIDMLMTAAFLHDVGKFRLPSKFCYSSIGSGQMNLNDKMKTHPIISYQAAKEDLRYPDAVARLILNHHEQLDGTGYPGGKSTADISREEHILFTANFIDNILAATKYNGIRMMIATLENTFNKYPGKFDGEVIVPLFARLKNSSRIERKFDRFRVQIPAIYKYRIGMGKTETPCTIIDISIGGMKIQSPEKLGIGKTVLLSFSLNKTTTIVDIPCLIMRVEDSGKRSFYIGIKYVNINEKDKQHLMDFLKNTKSSAKV